MIKIIEVTEPTKEQAIQKFIAELQKFGRNIRSFTQQHFDVSGRYTIKAECTLRV